MYSFFDMGIIDGRLRRNILLFEPIGRLTIGKVEIMIENINCYEMRIAEKNRGNDIVRIEIYYKRKRKSRGKSEGVFYLSSQRF